MNIKLCLVAARRTRQRFCWRVWAIFVIGLIGLASPMTAGEFVVEDIAGARSLIHQVRASQFLHHATFGPTIEQVRELGRRMDQIGQRQAMNEWIDHQFSLPVSLHQPRLTEMMAQDGYDQSEEQLWVQRYRHHAWWDAALRSEDQLRQRTAWALAQIFVISESGEGFNDRALGTITGVARWIGPVNYYDLLLRGSGGNLRRILREVVYHPVMGVYLSHLRNRKTNGMIFPDENFAREIMQLFTIGLHELHSDGRIRRDELGQPMVSYDNETVKSLARIFTGLTFDTNENSDPFHSGNDFCVPMVMFQPQHDTEPKTLFGEHVIDMVDGDAEIESAIDLLFDRRNLPPFIATRLIQRFVKSNPTRGYVRRVANALRDNGQGVRGDMRAVVRAILTDSEAFVGIKTRVVIENDHVVLRCQSRGTEYGKLREPVIRYTSLIRACRGASDDAFDRMMVIPQEDDLGQEPYRSPSVFNFYLPTFQAPGLELFQTNSRIAGDGLVSPEFQIVDAVKLNMLANHFIDNIENRRCRFVTSGGDGYDVNCIVHFDLQSEDQLSQTRVGLRDLINEFDLLHCRGAMRQNYKRRMIRQINLNTRSMLADPHAASEYAKIRTDAALIATLLSPFAAIEH